MSDADRLRGDQALDWVRRIQDSDFADWDAHIAWLEADPANAGAFDEALLLIEEATRGLRAAPALQPDIRADNDNAAEEIATGAARSRGWGLGIGLAAVAAGFIAMPSWWHGAPSTYLVSTPPGGRRTIALSDGTQIALNGNSVVRLDRDRPRLVALEKGEAFFTVVHDARKPFAVSAGAARFQDVGTSFDVAIGPGTIRMAVREGAVLYDPQGSAVEIRSGQEMEIARAGAVVRSVDTAGVGGWRQGQLVYRDASVGDVAADVGRAIGQPVSVDGHLARRSFTGVIVLDGDRGRTMRHVAAAIGASAVVEGSGWRLIPNGR